MQALLWDLRYALRQMGKAPGFAAAAIASLALGIGAATAVFSVIYAALISPYPYRDADRIVRLTVNNRMNQPEWIPLNGPEIDVLRQSPAFEDVVAMDGWSMPLTGGDFPEDVRTLSISSNGFDFLGEPVLFGRGLQPSDSIEGQEPEHVAVLSYRFWLRHYFGSRDILGKTLELDHTPYRIVGVAEPRFIWYRGDVYLPLKLGGDTDRHFIVNMRLRPGVTPSAASAAVQPLLEQFARNDPKGIPEHVRAELEGLNAWVIRDMGMTLYLLLGAVGLLLVIGCGNVSILLLARGTARAHELAVRAAIGARRGRIIRQLLTESLLLSVAGGVLGVGVAYGALAAMKMVLPRYEFAPEVVVTLNVPVLCFCVGVALLTGVVFGLSPALELSRPDPGRELQSGTRKVAGSVHGRRMHALLIGGQIALTLLLLAGAGAAIEGFVRLLHEPLGYDPDNVMSVWVPLRDNAYLDWAGRLAYFERLRSAVSNVPGVTEAAFSNNATPPGSGWSRQFQILGRPTSKDQEVRVELIGSNYFSILRIPLVRGRTWTSAENTTAAHIAVVNQTFERMYFPNGDAPGHSINILNTAGSGRLSVSPPGQSNAWLQIAGVVTDSRNDGLRNPVFPAVYIPYSLDIGRGNQILVRSRSNPKVLDNAIRLALAGVNPDQQASSEIEDLNEILSDQTEWQQEHLVAWLFSAFAVLALSLAALGLYSVVSYAVAQRTNEFGIRFALGAQRGHVLRIVFASVMISVGSGVIAGVLLTLSLKSVLTNWVGADARDLVMLPVGALVLSVVAALACYFPARRAARVDPMTALRVE